VVYPGESRNRLGQVVGHIYVNDGPERFDVAGGPPTSRPIADEGGHKATRTPAGQYVLDRAEHHTTFNWPNSVVPWGARIREVDLVVQYQLDGKWVDASGPKGRVTRAFLLFYTRSRTPISEGTASRYARQLFYDDSGKLMTRWLRNDFGNWSWNLRRGVLRTVFYLHTTPDDEATPDPIVDLIQSHGCLHIKPRDRNVMMSKGYLKEGTVVIVKPYEDRWRPR
jgi:hypothetical protein